MSDDAPSAENMSIPDSVKKDEPTTTEHIERTDVGASIEVKLTRGTGTRDSDTIKAKTKGATVGEAIEDMNELRPWLKELATDVRTWQPEADDE
jgi:hypothetical protein